jgi:hypothetical protein
LGRLLRNPTLEVAGFHPPIPGQNPVLKCLILFDKDLAMKIPTARILGALLAITILETTCAAQVAQWARWETAFNAATSASGQTTKLLVELTAPSGKRHVIDAFWDGDRVWRARFMPDEVGKWQFSTRAEPQVAGLHAQSGTFACVPAKGATRFDRHGAVRVSDDGRHFTHADGTPFFWLADTVWNGALLSSEDDWTKFLNDRRQKRFTAIQFVSTQWRTAYTDIEGMAAYTGYDSITINPAFFQRIEKRLRAVNAADMMAVPVLLWTLGSKEHNPGQLPEAQAVRLARYMVARFQGDHVIYFLPGDGNYSGANAERWRRIGRAVFDREGHAPATLHPQGMQWPFDAFATERWVSFFGYQSGHGDDANTLRWIHSGPPSEKWKLEPAKPVINLEPPYEDHVAYQSRQRHTDYTVRRASYWSVLNAPTAGVTYGAHGVWSWETEPREPQEHGGTGVAQPWHAAMNLPGSEQMKHMAALFESIDWWRLRPDQSVVRQKEASSVRTELSHVVYTRSGDGRAQLFLDGKPAAAHRISGDLGNWNDQFRLALANELTGDRPWLGEIRGVAIYDRALSPAEIERRAQGKASQPPDKALALYTFEEGSGETVRDRSGRGDPVDLRIDRVQNVKWLPGGGIAVTSPVLIASEQPALKINRSLKAANALTIEAWVKPANLTQSGPARIVTLSRDTAERNLTLGQDGAAYQARLRTTRTSQNGEPALDSPGGVDPARFIAAARSEKGDLAVIYFPVGDETTVALGHAGPDLKAEWFNPRTGERSMARPAQQNSFGTPDAQDWVLLFTR